MREFITLHLLDVTQLTSEQYQAFEKSLRLTHEHDHVESLLANTQTLLEGVEELLAIQVPCLHDKPGLDFFAEYKLSITGFMADGIQMGKKEGTMRPYRALLLHLTNFENFEPGRLKIEAYTAPMHQEFLRYLISMRDYHPNYISGICKNLTAYFNWCIRQGYKLHKEHAKISQKYIEPPRCVLTMDEVIQIMSVNVSKYNEYIRSLSVENRLGVPSWKTVERSRDSFAFACFTRLRYCDLFRLAENHILAGKEYDIIILHPTKAVTTRSIKIKKVVIPITEIPQTIREKYKGKHSTILPVPAATYRYL
ncbi:phage integrase SAM-like domain-containing protein [Siphonobacter sp. SORGH_AS_1065]|uniref:phage integrase SAM-like domain-containing protein n=1 Tax=Siphonobacter sp. SORGH_AS_1065 TaxID=3041795 RepID=UPI0027882E48|nr:phage integrase SAM-like domain-containing protein [Siphonobacter sp. SORGH_AS_1065]MDQ1089027.1 integrase [Siphonobacter sp. SORGH_AS_1065]